MTKTYASTVNRESAVEAMIAGDCQCVGVMTVHPDIYHTLLEQWEINFLIPSETAFIVDPTLKSHPTYLGKTIKVSTDGTIVVEEDGQEFYRTIFQDLGGNSAELLVPKL